MNASDNDFCQRLTTRKYCVNRIMYYYALIQGNFWTINNEKLSYRQIHSTIDNSKKLYYKMLSVVEYAKKEFPDYPWCMPMSYNEFFVIEKSCNLS